MSSRKGAIDLACELNEECPGDEPPAPLDPRLILEHLGFSVGVGAGGGPALWRLEHRGVLLCLRLFPPGDVWSCRSEAAAMRSAARGELPVPEVLAEGSWRGRPALILSGCRGRSVAETIRARPDCVGRLAEGTAILLAKLHRLAAPGILRALRDMAPFHAWAWAVAAREAAAPEELSMVLPREGLSGAIHSQLALWKQYALCAR